MEEHNRAVVFSKSHHGRVSASRRQFEEIVLPRIKGKGRMTLEIGCSSAMYRGVFDGFYVGLDITPIEFPESDEKHVFIVGDGCNLPFRDSCFDFVFCDAVLEHIRRPDKVVRETSRVLKDEREAFFGAPLPLAMKYESLPKFYGFTIKSLASLCQKSGLEITDHEYIGGPLAQLESLFEFILTRFLWNKKEPSAFSSGAAKLWDPRTKREGFTIRVRGYVISLIDFIEIKTGLHRIFPLGLNVWVKKRGDRDKRDQGFFSTSPHVEEGAT